MSKRELRMHKTFQAERNSIQLKVAERNAVIVFFGALIAAIFGMH